jgi:hypothetical protein
MDLPLKVFISSHAKGLYGSDVVADVLAIFWGFIPVELHHVQTPLIDRLHEFLRRRILEHPDTVDAQFLAAQLLRLQPMTTHKAGRRSIENEPGELHAEGIQLSDLIEAGHPANLDAHMSD